MISDYNYDDITTMHIPEVDCHYLAHQGDRDILPVIYPFQPVTKRTRLQDAKLKKQIHLMKSIPRLREIQETACANQAQRAKDIAAGRPVSYMTADDRKKLARPKRERKSCHIIGVPPRCLFSPLRVTPSSLCPLSYHPSSRNRLASPSWHMPL
jgi:hypothetical protein